MDFRQAWAKAQRGEYSGLFASEELYGMRSSPSHYGKSRPRRRLTPLQALQNKAAAYAHASNTRAHNNALNNLEQWARKARYGGYS